MSANVHVLRLQRTLLVGIAFALVPVTGCAPRVFADSDALVITGNPPPPPPPPEPEPVKAEAPKKPKRVMVTKDHIQINDKILFDTAKATIKEESFGLLDEIASVIKENPQIKKISIEGHTDSQGKSGYNKKLSKNRAKSVMKYLTDHGIEEGRLEYKGLGEDKPIADNETDEGREKNRRVEFVILEQADVKEEVEVDPETGEPNK